LCRDRVAQANQDMATFLGSELAGLRVRRLVLEGDPSGTIVDFAHNEQCDLIVMPTHGYGPFRRFLLGSVTAKVLHDADCPVWTGPHLEQAPEWTSFALRRIACALDLGPESRPVLAWAAAMAREFSADLAILHALPAATVSIEGFTFDPEWRLQLEKEAREQIARLQADLQVGGEVQIEVGDVAPAMRDAARDRNADLLVIGRSHGSGVLGRLRANAYSILREAPSPVVSI